MAEDVPPASPTARERWNARYRQRATETPTPPIGDLAASTPLGRLLGTAGLEPGGIAIDLAGGDGTGGLALAAQGLVPVVVDVSDVALDLATRRAAALGVTVRTVRLDMEELDLADVLDVVARSPTVAAGQGVSAISCVHYLNRRLLATVARDLPAGAVFLASIATTTNLERHARPSARFLLDPGELRQLVVGRSGAQDGVRVLHDTEHWTPQGSHEAEIVVARQPG